MYKLSKERLFFFLLLIISINSCLDTSQNDGSCTKCLSTQQLQNGSCYIKIRGCLTQHSNTCDKCQQGYILTNNTCIRQAQFLNITTLTPPPQTVDGQSLNVSQITPLLVGGYKQTTNFSSDFYLAAKSKLYQEYSNLSTMKIYKTQEQVVNGVNYMFYIISLQNYDLYLARVYVTLKLQASVQQIYKNDLSIKKGELPVQITLVPVPGVWRTFSNIGDQSYVESKNLLYATFKGLQFYKLQKVQYQLVAGINFLFYFSNSTYNQKFQAKVYRPFYGKAIVMSIWGSTPDEAMKAHSIVQTVEQPPSSGQFQVISVQDYDKEPFLTVKNKIKQIISDFQNSFIKKAQLQVVAGSNFDVTFSRPNENDTYLFRVYVPLGVNATASITFMKKNGETYIPVQNQTQSPSQVPVSGGSQIYLSSDYDKEPFLSVFIAIQKIFPLLTISMITKVQMQVVAGQNFWVYFSYPNSTDLYVVQAFAPLGYTGLSPSIESITKNGVQYNPQNNSITSVNDTVLTGQAQIYDPSKYGQEPFLSVKATIKKVFPDFTDDSIKKVQQQVVAGYNFIVNFVSSTDIYQAIVYVRLAYTGIGPEITSIKKNGVSFDSSLLSGPTKIDPIYNWQNDQTFTQLYKYFKNQVNITNIPAISEVLRQKKTLNGSNIDFYEYKIIYTSLEYAICRYYPDYNLNQVVSYIADKTQIYRLGSRLNVLTYDRSESVLVQKIKGSDYAKLNRIIIQDITQIKLSQKYKIYKISGYTSVGHYEITILDSGELFIVKTELLDKATCFSINPNSALQYRQQYVIDQIKTYLFSKYSFSGYQLTVALINSFSNDTAKYMILFTRNDYKKIKIQVEQTQDKFIIKKIDTLENGMYLISDVQLTKNLQDMARKDYKKQLQAFDRSIILSNSTHYIVKFSTFEKLATYTKIAQSSLSDFKQESFGLSTSCAVNKTDSTNLCQKCGDTDILWKGRCFRQILNCQIQIGSVCVICDKYSIPVNGKCLKDCGDIFSV